MKKFVDQRLTESYKKHNVKAMTMKQFITGCVLLLAFMYFALSDPTSFISIYFLVGTSLFLLNAMLRYNRNATALDRIVAEAHMNELHWDDESERFRYSNYVVVCG